MWVSQKVLYSINGKVYIQWHSSDIGCAVTEDMKLCQVSHKQLFSGTGQVHIQNWQLTEIVQRLWIALSGLTKELSSVNGQVHVQRRGTDTDCPVTADSFFRSHKRAILSQWTGACTEVRN